MFMLKMNVICCGAIRQGTCGVGETKNGSPIQNIKQRQTYYGALNLYHRDFVLMPHDSGNGKNTVAFIKHLQNLNPDKKAHSDLGWS
ncbi:MAG: hypothetical protein IPK68_23510 [Bdellovibrionales bacterium]|nr:hypothetical protein [Bdellovibrionales bacterium]